MPPTQLSALLMELVALPQETEWGEWKQNNDHPEMIAQRLSGLAPAIERVVSLNVDGIRSPSVTSQF